MKNFCVLLWSGLLIGACQSSSTEPASARVTASSLARPVMTYADSVPKPVQPVRPPNPEKARADPKAGSGLPAQSGAPGQTRVVPGSQRNTPAQHGFTEVLTLDKSILLDMRYATANNFTKSKIYDCARCLLRPEAAAALVKAQQALQKKGFGLKMFDCYRPRPYQQRLWDKVPNPDYVTPPAKGSMHARGAAVDLTVVDATGHELDMGTPYDFFGQAAHTDQTNLPAQVLQNRRLLRETLEAAGFKGIRTEWWHFSYQKKSYPLADYVWPCDQ